MGKEDTLATLIKDPHLADLRENEVMEEETKKASEIASFSFDTNFSAMTFSMKQKYL